ncbi:tetratricopeptide repeat protein [Bartonella australis AUST/NH1]|uniref:Tetratricopeptide repeat protein n=1 Tax=Bartonella australis (strain Aust/NH1) TaxID=1094489 RepID=M1NSA2_BARAA|nr:tetratricopeptide repeat protein [Bartonella australis]AGF74228.1 tetratricopeptide repeat protein [Bartonella australis AUST/NH1]
MCNATISRFFIFLIAGSMLVPSITHGKTNATSFAGAYLAGRIANYERKTNLAIDYFKQALSYEPGNIQAQKEMLEAALSVGEFKEAVEIAQKLKLEGITSPFVSLTLSVDNLIKKNYKDAKKSLQVTSPSSANNPISELIDAWATFGSGRQSEAIANLEKHQGPIWYNLFVHYHLALMNNLMGRTQNAQKYFTQALNNTRGAAVAPDTYERVIIAYASFQLRHKMRDQALKTIRHGEQTLSGWGILKNIRKRVEKGAHLANPVTTPQQGAGEALYDFGTALNRGNLEWVARIFGQLSLTLYPQNDAALFQLAHISAKLNDYEQAVKFYRALPANSPYYRDSQMRLALILAHKNNHDEAVNLLTLLEKKIPNDHYIFVVLADIYTQQNKFAEAVEVMNRAIAQITNFQQNDWKLFYQRGVILERLGRWQEAEADLRKALEFSPDQPQVLNYLGYSLIDRGQKLEESLQMLQKASSLQSRNGYILDSLGWAYYKLGQYDDAVKTLETAVKLQPEDPTLNDHLGDVYWRTGRKREAVFQWNHALDGKPKNPEKIEEKLKFGLPETTILDHNNMKQ